jgi:hypothetical protein
MAKRSIDDWNSDVEEEEQEITSLEEEAIPLQLLKDLHLNIQGKVTGKWYVFGGGGSIVDVDKADAEIMLQKMSGSCNCPGGVGATPYFSIAR